MHASAKINIAIATLQNQKVIFEAQIEIVVQCVIL